jgi:hypothetical protein
MVVNDAACLLTKRGALESIASKLAPTESLTEQHYTLGWSLPDRQAGRILPGRRDSQLVDS